MQTIESRQVAEGDVPIGNVTVSQLVSACDNSYENICTQNIVDLAGSERATATAGLGQERFQETTSINQSLTTLGAVICDLSEG